MNTAADVTDLVLVKQQAEEAEEALRAAVELAELGTWRYDIGTGLIYYSGRLSAWCGFEPGVPVTLRQALRSVQAADRQEWERTIAAALLPGSGGVFDVTYTVIDYRTGRERILHAQGKVVMGAHGKPLRMSGTAQNVTVQRKLQLALELQVQERTEELQAMNEELTAINEELHQANEQLLHSNEELAQYAYVASHDLQEPLRKIQMFSGILGNKKELPQDQRALVDKISQSSERMTQLIRDLLEFSRLTNADMLLRPVDLSVIVAAVVTDFELIIQEKEATIEIGSLPVIEAVSLQMNQLFHNLLSNALKFIKPGTTPRVKLTAKVIPESEAAQFIQKTTPGCIYYSLAFSDNGIGFETKYAEQIFEVFKRLHGREAYPGSGIGLALCRRIVTNHHGYLYSESTPGKGTIFYIILPETQGRNG
jgi:signal transduction histidine kinase